MAKKPTKKQIQEAAAALVNEHLRAGTADQIPLETILLTLPGGAGGEAQIYACHSLKSSPGMTMDALQNDACAEAELNYSTAGWIVGREWGNWRGFGGLDYLWERRHERLDGDRRARWHYYLLPAGETLAKADPRVTTRTHNLTRIQSLPKPGDLLSSTYYLYDKWSSAEVWQLARRSGGDSSQLRTFIATCYVGMVREWRDDRDGSRRRDWAYIAASDPNHENWHTVMGSRQLFLGCLSDEGTRIAVPILDAVKA